VFWSKIWFFLVAVLGAVALTIALVMPRPGERNTRANERTRLQGACLTARILLENNARQRVQLAGDIARSTLPGSSKAGLGQILLDAGKADAVSAESHAKGKETLLKLRFESAAPNGDDSRDEKSKKSAKGSAPDFILALDNKGRVVARTGGSDDYNDNMRGYYLIDDALAGYLRDDLWLLGRRLYAVAGSPVVTNSYPLELAGAVVTGREITNDFAAGLQRSLGVEVAFYAGEEALAASSSAQIHEDVVKQTVSSAPDNPVNCSGQPIQVATGGEVYDVLLARLPGEAGVLGAFYAVYAPRNKQTGFAGTFDALTKEDIGFANFPWIAVIFAFVLVFAGGIGLMWIEADRPLRRLARDAVRLAQGEKERLDEALHRGKSGSIARSVNIAIDKLHRETKAARQDLDELLGPVPGENIAPAVLPPAALSNLGPNAPAPPNSFAPPPPSEFRFSDSSQRPLPGTPNANPSVRAAAGPHMRPSTAPGRSSLPRRVSTQDLTGTSEDTGVRELDLPPPPPNVSETPNPSFASDRRVPPRGIALPTGTLPAARLVPNPPVLPLEDDILSNQDLDAVPSLPTDDERTVVSDASSRIASQDSDTVYFREVFEDFLALKRKCGEKTDNLTFERFAAKLRNNRDALLSKHRCRTVRFQVYVKDGKAALKASPVR
jgi:hypothetical protein